MNQFEKQLLELQRQVDELRRTTVRYRQGEITDTSPLSVALGGSDVPLEGVKAVDASVLDEGDIVSVLTWARDVLILGRLGDGVQPAWTAATLLHGWANFGAGNADAQFYKDSLGVVRLRGVIKSGTTTPGTTIFTLPAGYRPVVNNPVACTANGAHCELTINASGNVDTAAGASAVYTSLAGITFRAEQ